MTPARHVDLRVSEIPWIKAVPRHWGQTQFRAVFRPKRVKNTGMVESHLLSLSYGRIVPRDIGSSDGLVPESYETYQIVDPDDIIFRFTDLQNDKRSLRSARATERGIITSAYVAVKPIDIEARYAEYLMRSYDLAKVFYGLGGGVRQSLKFSDVALLPVLLPPASEQQAIADFLDRETRRIDELIAEQRGLIETLRGRRQAVVRRATTLGIDESIAFVDSGVKWLGPIRADAQLTRVRFLADVNTGHGDTQDSNPDGAYPFYVRSESIEKSNNFDYIGPAVLTSGDGAGVGKVFHHVTDSRFMAHQRVYVIDNFRNVDSRYFFYVFSAHFAMVALDGSARSTVDSVRRHMITNFPVVVPSIDRQLRVVEYLDDQTSRIDELISESEDLIALSHERRAALITAAVTGQIDVRAAA